MGDGITRRLVGHLLGKKLKRYSNIAARGYQLRVVYVCKWRSIPASCGGSSSMSWNRFVILRACIAYLWWNASVCHTTGKKKKHKKEAVGIKCEICDRVAMVAKRMWQPDSRLPDYIPSGELVARIEKDVCNQNVLTALPNRAGHALHIPSIKWSCEE